MNVGEAGYLAFGAALVILFAVIVRHYYARSRRAKVCRWMSMGEIFMDSAASLFVCVAAGTPGTWVKVVTA